MTTISNFSTATKAIAGVVLVLALAVALLSAGVGKGDYNPPSQPVA